MANPVRIYLTDLNNDLRGKPYPLNVGYIASYLLSQQDGLSVRLFKDPKALCDAIQDAPPHILGMSNFSWNTQLNLAVSQWAKKHNPEIVTVYGGLNLTVNDNSSVRGFFRNNPFIDAYVYFTPEETMKFFVQKLIQYDFKLEKLLASEPLPSGLMCHVNGEVTKGTVQMFEFKKDLDYIPSPYLTGLMDEFIAHKDLFPIFETCRGCPYSCTFCCWGARTLSKLQTYSMERVLAELNYIGSAKPKNKYLYCADGNFGILKRDVEIAHHLRRMYDTEGFPDPIFLYLAKNSTDNILEIAKILSPIFQVNIARQSESEVVLKNIKRTNISAEAFQKIQKTLDNAHINNQLEIIYPLPGETLQSFYDGLKGIMDKVDPEKAEIRLYPLFLLPGSEMSETQYIEKFGLKTAVRRSCINSGFEYKAKNGESIYSVEVDEIVVSTNTFSFEDAHNIRVFHLFLCMFQTYKIYAHILKYLKEKCSLNAIAFLQEVVDGIMKVSAEEYPFLKGMLDQFLSDIHEELYFDYDRNNVRGIIKDFKHKENKRWNIYYVIKLLYTEEIRKDFYGFLTEKVMQKYMPQEEVRDLVNYADSFIIDFNNYSASKTETIRDPLSGETKIFKLDVRENVDQCWQRLRNEKTSLYEALDNVYQLTYPGHLNKVLLYRSENQESASKPLIYTLH